MANETNVLCDIHRTSMEMIQYKWSVFPGDENISAFMHCSVCTRHYSPRQGYVNITEQRMDTSNRRMNPCPNESIKPHGSMAIVAMKDGEFVWKCLHQECKEKKTNGK
jgi:hypothetical protein